MTPAEIGAGVARCLVAMVVLVASHGAQAASRAAAEIEWGDCPQIAATTSAAAMDCGWLVSGQRVNAQPVRLRVIVLRARPDKNDSVPVIHLPGGPGDSAGLDGRRLARWREWQQQVGWPHDIVLFDPRGTGASQPRLRCAGALSVPYRRVDANGGALAVESEAMRRCLQRLGSATIEGLGPRAQLRDLAALIEALGVERASLWAVSYGTRIAQLFAQRYPARVAHLVLDSLVPFDRNELRALPRQIDSAINRLQTWCDQNNGHCASAHPRAALAALLARYVRQPPSVALTAYPGLSGRFQITPYRLLIMLLLASYDNGRQADTVQRLERALKGDGAALAPLAARMAALDQSSDRSDAVFWSTRCALVGAQRADEWAAVLAQTPLIAPYLVAARQASPCRNWPGPRVARPDRGAALDMPVLVIAGLDDVITPARWARAFVADHPGARAAWIADAAHVPTLFNDCAQRAVARFLRDAQAAMPRCAVSAMDQSGR